MSESSGIPLAGPGQIADTARPRSSSGSPAGCEAPADPLPESNARRGEQQAAPATSRDPSPAEGADAADASEAPETHLWLRRGDQLFLGVLIVAALVLMLAHWVRLSGWGMQPVEIKRLESRQYDYQIDVNQATWVEWIQLEGIGETLARRIIEDRDHSGPFESIDDLQRVKGIGPKTVEKLRPWLTVAPLE